MHVGFIIASDIDCDCTADRSAIFVAYNRIPLVTVKRLKIFQLDCHRCHLGILAKAIAQNIEFINSLRLTVKTERKRESAKTTLRPAATTITTIVIIELFLKLGVADGIPPWQLLTQCSGTSNFTVTSLIRSADASIVARIGAVVACCAFYDNIYRSRFISSRVIVWKSRILSLYAKPSQAKWRMRIRCIYHRVGDKSNITPKENGRIQ
mmetsp:Transcript_4317/g.10070  ORF Transcript_4317/g.10070 Transcript_4317/m.10070 type:complete len:209 (+) Transcript_4317:805-1431(+)